MVGKSELELCDDWLLIVDSYAQEGVLNMPAGEKRYSISPYGEKSRCTTLIKKNIVVHAPEKETSKSGRGKDKKGRYQAIKANKNVSQSDILNCLALQKIFNRVDLRKLRHIAKVGEVIDYKTDQVIVSQGDIGGHVYFILNGNISVVINGKKVATRSSKECVGEMTMLDPTQKRSATLIAMEDSRVLKVKEDVVKKLFQKNQSILEGIALELALRLREHTTKITKGNDVPNVFIGSSSEFDVIAEKIGRKLPKDEDIKPVLWQNGVFELSKSNIESLCAMADKADFGVFILSKDDLTKSRGKKSASPRDNVLFEFGLFMGCIGRDRTFAICCAKNLKIPSDLNGVSFIMLDVKGNKKKVNVSTCIEKLRAEILRKGIR